MNPRAITEMAIMSELSRVPDSRLDSIRAHVESLIVPDTAPAPKKGSLKGIWRGLGFERIADLQGELQRARRELEDAILRREF